MTEKKMNPCHDGICDGHQRYECGCAGKCLLEIPEKLAMINPCQKLESLTPKVDYLLITLDELAEIADLSENICIVESMPEKKEFARKRIELSNRIRSRKLVDNLVWMTPEEEEKRIRKDEREKVYDANGILHGEAAKQFNEYMNEPRKPASKEAEDLIAKAYEYASKDNKP